MVMNERIKLLAEQAFFDENTNQPSDKMYTFTEHKMKQFAELIVKECMTVCADNACRAGGLNTQVGEDLYLAADLIKEHFGVEE
jgi:hypothetical protein